MRYEEIGEAHVPMLAPLYVEAFNAPPWNDRWTLETASRRLRQMLRCEGAYGLSCFDGDELVGMILGEPDLFYDCDQMYIKEFCVALARRGGGIGSALLSEYERRLRARDCLFVDNSVANLDAAERLGIEPILFNRDGEPYGGQTVYSFDELALLLAQKD